MNCPQVGSGGLHSESFLNYEGPCKWCGAVPPTAMVITDGCAHESLAFIGRHELCSDCGGVWERKENGSEPARIIVSGFVIMEWAKILRTAETMVSEMASKIGGDDVMGCD